MPDCSLLRKPRGCRATPLPVWLLDPVTLALLEQLHHDRQDSQASMFEHMSCRQLQTLLYICPIQARKLPILQPTCRRQAAYDGPLSNFGKGCDRPESPARSTETFVSTSRTLQTLYMPDLKPDLKGTEDLAQFALFVTFDQGKAQELSLLAPTADRVCAVPRSDRSNRRSYSDQGQTCALQPCIWIWLDRKGGSESADCSCTRASMHLSFSQCP